jgi:ferredoxin
MDRMIVIETKKPPSGPSIPRTREEFCIGCGVCEKVCPVKDVNEIVSEEVLGGVVSTIVEVPKTKREMKVAVEGGSVELLQFCIRCRRCVDECPADARIFEEVKE